MKNLLRLLTVSFLIVIFFSLFLKPANAYESHTRESLLLDTGLSDQSTNSYGYPDAVVVAKITVDSVVSFGRGEDWAQGLYYYMITHLNFLDIPFNHIISWQGDVIEGKGGGMEVKSLSTFTLSKDYVNPQLVVYFDNGRGMTNQGRDGLSEYVTDLVSTYSIPAEDVIPGSLSFTISNEGQPSSLGVSLLAEGDIVDWVESWRSTFKVTSGLDIENSGTMGDITLPEEIGAGETFTVKITAENTGDAPWYNSGAHATFIGTSDKRDRNSSLYIADVWSSFARVVAPTDMILPGSEATFEFTARAPVLPGSYSEKFELIRLGEGWLSNTQFELAYDVVPGNLDIVEILDTETGYLNVRSCARTSCEAVGTVEPGYQTVSTGKDGNWYKIIYDGANEGWVYGKYVKEL